MGRSLEGRAELAFRWSAHQHGWPQAVFENVLCTACLLYAHWLRSCVLQITPQGATQSILCTKGMRSCFTSPPCCRIPKRTDSRYLWPQGLWKHSRQTVTECGMIITMIYTLETRCVTVSRASVTRASSDTCYSLCVDGEQGLGSILLLPLSSEEGSEMLVSVWCTHICTCPCVAVVLKTY